MRTGKGNQEEDDYGEEEFGSRREGPSSNNSNTAASRGIIILPDPVRRIFRFHSCSFFDSNRDGSVWDENGSGGYFKRFSDSVFFLNSKQMQRKMIRLVRYVLNIR